MPLLQFTLDQLFQRRSGRQLTLSAYRELGGVSGALTRQAEEIYTALPSEEHRRLSRELFVRLIDPGATEQDTTRRRAALSEFTLADPTQTRLMRETIDTFIAVRLLTTNEVAGTTTIEVSHEALIREWPRLAGWLREARDDIRLQQTISKDAAGWERYNKSGDRLYRGSQLKEAQSWARRNTPSGNEVTFLRAGVARRMRSIASVTAIVFLLLSTTGMAGWLFSRIPPDPTRVSTLQDNDNPGSLRYAVDESRAGSTITFDTSLRGTILLTNGNLNIVRNLKILGPGAGKLTIIGRKSEQGSDVSVFPGVSVTISGLAFKGSQTSNSNEYSGGIYNSGTLTLSNCIVSNNTGFDGGGIYNGGRLTLTNSTVSGNTASSNGGGIFIQSTFGSSSTAQADLIFGTIYNNIATFGVDIAVKDVALSTNGEYRPAKQISHVKISSSIVAGDAAHPGPDIVGMLTSYGYNLFQDNSGATFDLAARKQHATDKTLTVNNLSKLFAAPLGRQDNGGPTKTYALGSGSPALDQIPLDACHVKGITTDQRGMKRPDGNERFCDIGAYEYVDSG